MRLLEAVDPLAQLGGGRRGGRGGGRRGTIGGGATAQEVREARGQVEAVAADAVAAVAAVGEKQLRGGLVQHHRVEGCRASRG